EVLACSGIFRKLPEVEVAEPNSAEHVADWRAVRRAVEEAVFAANQQRVERTTHRRAVVEPGFRLVARAHPRAERRRSGRGAAQNGTAAVRAEVREIPNGAERHGRDVDHVRSDGGPSPGRVVLQGLV